MSENDRRTDDAESRHGEVTRLLGELRLGHEDSLERLMPLVYRDLRKLAGSFMRREGASHTLPTTALVHEAYLRLADQRNGIELRFFAGLTEDETAAVLDISPRTVKRDWQVARAWLDREIGAPL